MLLHIITRRANLVWVCQSQSASQECKLAHGHQLTPTKLKLLAVLFWYFVQLLEVQLLIIVVIK